MRWTTLSIFLLTLTPPAFADGVLDKVGSAVGKGLKAVGETIESTSDLVQNEETPAQTRAKLDAMEQDVMARLLAQNEQALDLLEISAGYAAFDMRQVTIFPLSGGFGRGVAILAAPDTSPTDPVTDDATSEDTTPAASETDGLAQETPIPMQPEKRVYMQMGTGGVGAAFGIGGFASQFVIMFETQTDFDRFVENGYDAGADAGYMEGDDRGAQTVQFTEGRSVFVLDKTGWRVNANATGTKYWPDEDLN